MKVSKSRNSAEVRCSRMRQSCRRAASWSRAKASTLTASAAMPLTSQNATAVLLRSSSPHTRVDSPGRSARAIGPRMAKVSSPRRFPGITAHETPGRSRTHRSLPASFRRGQTGTARASAKRDCGSVYHSRSSIDASTSCCSADSRVNLQLISVRSRSPASKRTVNSAPGMVTICA